MDPTSYHQTNPGILNDEIKILGSGHYVDLEPISDFFDDPYFETKYIVYVQH